jgi:hypothetical protein
MQDLLSLVLTVSRAGHGDAAAGAAGTGQSVSGAGFARHSAAGQALRAVCSAAIAVQQSGMSSSTTLR